MPGNPVDRVRRPKLSSESPRLGLDRDELRRFLEAAVRGSPCDHALCRLLARNSLRVSEALAARLEDIGEERGHCTLTVAGNCGTKALVPLAP